MKGFGIIGLAAIAGLIGYFCEPALRPVLTPGAKIPAKPAVAPAQTAPAPQLTAVPEPPKPELPAQPAPEPTAPAAETSAPSTEPEAPVESKSPAEPETPTEPTAPAEPETPVEPEAPAEPTPDQPEETVPAEPAPATTGKVDLPPAQPLPSVTPATENAENSPVIVAMQESFQNDGLKEFAQASPTRWQAGAEETIKGETYQTGLLDYLAHTPFGGKAMQVKALLRDGKVVKWVSLTGKELK